MIAEPLVRRCSFGAYVDNEPWPDNARHYELERRLELPLTTMSWFQSWDNDWLDEQAGDAAANGRDLLIAWEPWDDDRRPVPFDAILAGRYDDYVLRFLRGAAKHPRRVVIRFGHEMNGDWYPWSVAARRSAVASTWHWITVWRRLVALQRSVGGPVRWMWCVNNLDLGGLRAEDYWPGADAVDVLGIDAYNGYAGWRPPRPLVADMYRRVCRLHRRAPVWLAEVGCREPDRTEKVTKSEWHEALFAERRLRRLERVVFFSANKEHDWRLDSSPDVVEAFRQVAPAARRG